MRNNQAGNHCKVLEEFEEHLANTVGAAQSTRKMYLRYCCDFLRDCIGEGKGGKGTFVPSVLDWKVEGDHSSRACAGLAD